MTTKTTGASAMDKDIVENIRRLQASLKEGQPAFKAPPPVEETRPSIEAALKSAGDGDGVLKYTGLWGVKNTPSGMPDIAVSKLDINDVPEVIRSLVPQDEATYVPQGLNEFVFTKAMEDNQRVLLSGPKGSGKSTLPKVFAARTGRPFLRVQCNSSMEYEDLFGNLSVRGGEVVFEDGPVTQAARYGGIVCLDEASTLRAGAAMGLQWTMEKGGKIHLPSFPSDNPEDKYVTPHKEFRLVLTDNTTLAGDDTGQYVGTNVQNAAFRDRIDIFIRVGYMSATAEYAMVQKHVPDVPDHVLKNMIKFAGEIRNGFEKGTCESTVSPRVLLRWARDAVAFGNVGFALRYTFVNGVSTDDESVISAIYGKVFGEKLPVV